MKADKDDAPTYVRPSARRSNMTTWVVASFLGSAFTVGLLYTLSSLYMQDKVDRRANTPKPKPAPVAEITRAAPAEKDWDRIVEEQARRDAMSEQRYEQPTGLDSDAVKQTVFDDKNYTRKDAINLINAREWGSAEPYEETRKHQKEQKILVIGQENTTKDWICSYQGKEGSIKQRDCKSRYQLNNRNTER
ncbi:hypothetical protein Pstr01_33190 [Pseudomonas straminea]|uniref:Uncharacterized protein n=1 Tax=Pseudomonas straminea TaxID=47882 RepID=A0A1I1WN24_PSEOC|nr:hypothetical protein [Pseudomonas straminea]GLX15080.1 hypothetical protein Pstr01_33190 [Pseudomonas straminea]SFD96536.1 hypothetical protein SAMN05216372_10666 [Pseudomonas straminea]